MLKSFIQFTLDKWELFMDIGSAGQALWAKLEIIVIDIEFNWREEMILKHYVTYQKILFHVYNNINNKFSL